jgi:hypothetical protein
VPESEAARRKRVAMNVRVVRFTDVSAERIEALRTRLEEADGPPEGVRATALTVLFDEAHGTAVVLQHFANAEDMEEGDRIFGAMDPGETPGTRASVDMCGVAIELKQS